MTGTDGSGSTAPSGVLETTALGAIEAAHTLADEGLASQKYFFAVLEELWRSCLPGSAWSTWSTGSTGSTSSPALTAPWAWARP
jgi:hypothetical protein